MDSHGNPLIRGLNLSCICMQITHAVMPDEKTMVHVAITRQYKRAPGESDAMCFTNSHKLQQQAVDLVVVEGDVGGHRREVGGSNDVHLRVERLDLRKQPLQIRGKRRDVHLHASTLLRPSSSVPPSRNVASQYAMHTCALVHVLTCETTYTAGTQPNGFIPASITAPWITDSTVHAPQMGTQPACTLSTQQEPQPRGTIASCGRRQQKRTSSPVAFIVASALAIVM